MNMNSENSSVRADLFDENADSRRKSKGKRRSSILKMAKSPKSALDDIDPNTQNSDDGCSTAKSKNSRRSSSRRVSFASTCQIKEFVPAQKDVSGQNAWQWNQLSNNENTQENCNTPHGKHENEDFEQLDLPDNRTSLEYTRCYQGNAEEDLTGDVMDLTANQTLEIIQNGSPIDERRSPSKAKTIELLEQLDEIEEEVSGNMLYYSEETVCKNTQIMGNTESLEFTRCYGTKASRYDENAQDDNDMDFTAMYDVARNENTPKQQENHRQVLAQIPNAAVTGVGYEEAEDEGYPTNNMQWRAGEGEKRDARAFLQELDGGKSWEGDNMDLTTCMVTKNRKNGGHGFPIALNSDMDMTRCAENQALKYGEIIRPAPDLIHDTEPDMDMTRCLVQGDVDTASNMEEQDRMDMTRCLPGSYNNKEMQQYNAENDMYITRRTSNIMVLQDDMDLTRCVKSAKKRVDDPKFTINCDTFAAKPRGRDNKEDEEMDFTKPFNLMVNQCEDEMEMTKCQGKIDPYTSYLNNEDDMDMTRCLPGSYNNKEMQQYNAENDMYITRRTSNIMVLQDDMDLTRCVKSAKKRVDGPKFTINCDTFAAKPRGRDNKEDEEMDFTKPFNLMVNQCEDEMEMTKCQGKIDPYTSYLNNEDDMDMTRCLPVKQSNNAMSGSSAGNRRVCSKEPELPPTSTKCLPGTLNSEESNNVRAKSNTSNNRVREGAEMIDYPMEITRCHGQDYPIKSRSHVKENDMNMTRCLSGTQITNEINCVTTLKPNQSYNNTREGRMTGLFNQQLDATKCRGPDGGKNTDGPRFVEQGDMSVTRSLLGNKEVSLNDAMEMTRCQGRNNSPIVTIQDDMNMTRGVPELQSKKDGLCNPAMEITRCQAKQGLFSQTMEKRRCQEEDNQRFADISRFVAQESMNMTRGLAETQNKKEELSNYAMDITRCPEKNSPINAETSRFVEQDVNMTGGQKPETQKNDAVRNVAVNLEALVENREKTELFDDQMEMTSYESKDDTKVTDNFENQKIYTSSDLKTMSNTLDEKSKNVFYQQMEITKTQEDRKVSDVSQLGRPRPMNTADCATGPLSSNKEVHAVLSKPKIFDKKGVPKDTELSLLQMKIKRCLSQRQNSNSRTTTKAAAAPLMEKNSVKLDTDVHRDQVHTTGSENNTDTALNGTNKDSRGMNVKTCTNNEDVGTIVTKEGKTDVSGCLVKDERKLELSNSAKKAGMKALEEKQQMPSSSVNTVGLPDDYGIKKNCLSAIPCTAEQDDSTRKCQLKTHATKADSDGEEDEVIITSPIKRHMLRNQEEKDTGDTSAVNGANILDNVTTTTTTTEGLNITRPEIVMREEISNSKIEQIISRSNSETTRLKQSNVERKAKLGLTNMYDMETKRRHLDAKEMTFPFCDETTDDVSWLNQPLSELHCADDDSQLIQEVTNDTTTTNPASTTHVVANEGDDVQSLAEDARIAEDHKKEVENCFTEIRDASMEYDKKIKEAEIRLNQIREKKKNERKRDIERMEAELENLESELRTLETERERLDGENENLCQQIATRKKNNTEMENEIHILENKMSARNNFAEVKKKLKLTRSLVQWTLDEYDDLHFKFTFLCRTFELLILFDDQDKSMNNPEQKVHKISFESRLSEKTTDLGRLAHSLAHNYFSQFDFDEMCPTRGRLPQLLHFISVAIARLEIFLTAIDVISLDHLISLNQKVLKIGFSSLRNFLKFELNVDMSNLVTDGSLIYTVNKKIGDISSETIDEKLKSIPSDVYSFRQLIQCAETYL